MQQRDFRQAISELKRHTGKLILRPPDAAAASPETRIAGPDHQQLEVAVWTRDSEGRSHGQLARITPMATM